MISRLSLGRRGTAVAGVVLAGGLVAGGATAFAATTGSSTTAPSGTASAPAAKAHHPRVRRMLPGIHGQATVKNRKTGSFVVREWQRGTVVAIAGDRITVRSADGTSWTWTVVKNAKITRDGKKIAESALGTGDTVEVVGRQNGAVNDATRIFAPSAAQLAKAKTKAAQRANG